MDFASKYIYTGPTAESEETGDFSDDEMNEFGASFEDEGSLECEVMEPGPGMRVPECEMIDRKPRQQPKDKPATAPVSTNNINMDLSKLMEIPDVCLKKDEKQNCEKCGAFLSHIDLPQEKTEEKVQWTCKFCGHQQEMTKTPPSKNDVAYVTEPDIPLNIVNVPPEPNTTVFVLDTSGSMSMSYKINAQRLDARLKQLASDEQNQVYLMCSPDMGAQQIQQIPTVEFVSRLQIIKASVLEQIGIMKDNDRVHLVLFNDQMESIGNFTNGTDFDALSTSRKMFEEKIKSLPENGATALGPALNKAVELASESKVSKVSRIVLCTDGKANVGYGKLVDDKGNPVDDSQKAQSKEFYNNLITDCQLDGISVYIVSFDDCDVGYETCLGDVPVKTGGWLQRTQTSNPNMTSIFNEIMKSKVIATDAHASLITSTHLCLKESGQTEATDSNVYRNLGNVRHGMTLGYDFKMKTGADDAMNGAGTANTPSQDAAQPAKYPFQFKITYKLLDGRDVTRVWTNELEVTDSQEKVEQSTDARTILLNFFKACASGVLSATDHNRIETVKDCLRQSATMRSIKAPGDLNAKLSQLVNCLKAITRQNKIKDDTGSLLRSIEAGTW